MSEIDSDSDGSLSEASSSDSEFSVLSFCSGSSASDVSEEAKPTRIAVSPEGSDGSKDSPTAKADPVAGDAEAAGPHCKRPRSKRKEKVSDLMRKEFFQSAAAALKEKGCRAEREGRFTGKFVGDQQKHKEAVKFKWPEDKELQRRLQDRRDAKRKQASGKAPDAKPTAVKKKQKPKKKTSKCSRCWHILISCLNSDRDIFSLPLCK